VVEGLVPLLVFPGHVRRMQAALVSFWLDRLRTDPSSAGVMASSLLPVSWRYMNMEAPPAPATTAPVIIEDDHDAFSLIGELDEEAVRLSTGQIQLRAREYTPFRRRRAVSGRLGAPSAR
jgi:hypothetical protein